MKTKTPIHIRLAYAALLVAGLCLLYILYLVLQPTPQVTVNQPIPLDKRVVSDREILTMNVRYCSPKDITQKVEVQLVDISNNDAAYPIYTLEEPELAASCKTSELKINTARFDAFAVDSGSYKLRLRSVVNINQIKHDVQLFDSQQFTYNKG